MSHVITFFEFTSGRRTYRFVPRTVGTFGIESEPELLIRMMSDDLVVRLTAMLRESDSSFAYYLGRPSSIVASLDDDMVMLLMLAFGNEIEIVPEAKVMPRCDKEKRLREPDRYSRKEK